MRVVLDACVLFPTIMREMLMSAAEQGGFVPLWSERILEEWARATHRLGPLAEEIARGEVALLKATWPKAIIPPGQEDGLSLPDPDDLHVLATAIEGGADWIITNNLKDFPIRSLTPHGLSCRGPDGFLVELAQAGTVDLVASATAMKIRADAAAKGEPRPMRTLLKRAGLPRVAKFVNAALG